MIPEDGGVHTNEEGTLLLRGIGGEEGFAIEMPPFILMSKRTVKSFENSDNFIDARFKVFVYTKKHKTIHVPTFQCLLHFPLTIFQIPHKIFLRILVLS